MKKQNRLLTPKDYQHVFKAGVRQKGERFTFVFSKNTLSYARLGLAIAKRAVPNAVDRNRIRRLVREGFRHRQLKLAGLDIIVMTGHCPSNRNMTHEELSLQWTRLLASQKGVS